MGLDSLEEPKTPDQSLGEVSLPPPPPQHHSTQRIRKSRTDNLSGQYSALPTILFASDIPIPSVESVRAKDPFHSDPPQEMGNSSPTQHLHLPSQRHHPTPQTPLAQTKKEQAEDRENIWTMERPSSALSIRSDSSASSLGSFVSYPSFGGSCTSPESDMTDPFLPRSINLTIPHTPSKPSRLFTNPLNCATVTPKPRWSVEQDNHLWNTYQIYLSDPTITPFKTVPGSLPPLGVCHRVAREARRTWPRATRISQEIVHRHTLRDVFDDANAAHAGTGSNEREATPTGNMSQDARRPCWPRESATRRRLKELCKRKFSIAPHYQRLMQSRSPSPFLEPFWRRSASQPPLSSPAEPKVEPLSSTTRDLGISLVASGATAPLAQLVTNTAPEHQSEDWFNTPVAPPASSPPAVASDRPRGLGLDSETMNIPRLASPFKPNTWGPSRARHNLSGSGQFDTVHATGSRLLSSTHVDTSANVNKRRAEQQLDIEVSPGGSDLQHRTSELVFTGNANNINHRRIRLRNRGTTVGAVSGRERIERLFAANESNATASETVDFDDAAAAASSSATVTSTSPTPLGQNLLRSEKEEKSKRLGSPFELDPKKRSHPSKSPRHIPSLSDPFVSHLFSGPASPPRNPTHQLAAFGAMQGHHSAQASHIEDSLSDAERIRRQLLSRP